MSFERSVVVDSPFYIAPLALDDNALDCVESIAVLSPAINKLLDATRSLESDDGAESQFYPAFGYVPRLTLPEQNFDASEFMMDNINEIKRSIVRMGVELEMVNDLFNDVYISIREDELDGRGYDITCDTDLRQFVFGRIKGYSRNKRYNSRYVERKGGCVVVAATPDETTDSSEECLNSFQAAYRNAADEGDIDGIDMQLSVRDAIETCVDFCHGTSISIINLFKNVEHLNEHLARYKKTKNGNSVFTELQGINRKHPELLEAMTLAFEYRAKHKEEFMQILEEFCI